jgi:hypothetical protein
MVHGLGSLKAARAGCNHLVVARSDALHEWDQLDQLIAGNSTAVSPDDLASGSQGPFRHKPCSGLSCSSRNPLPASTASFEREGSDQWGTVDALAVVVVSGQDIPRGGEPAARPSGQAAAVFRPPPI